jgi:hypothetical protein
MKNLILLIIAIFAYSAFANAQVDESAIKKDVKNINKEESALKQEKKAERQQLRKLKGMEVSYEAKQQFGIDFPKVTEAKWKRTTNFDEATFTMKGKER